MLACSGSVISFDFAEMNKGGGALAEILCSECGTAVSGSPNLLYECGKMSKTAVAVCGKYRKRPALLKKCCEKPSNSKCQNALKGLQNITKRQVPTPTCGLR